MVAVLNLVDEELGGERCPVFALRLASERITARELIRRRVEEEIARLNAEREGLDADLSDRSFHVLAKHPAEVLLNPRRRKTEAKPLDPEEQTRIAWKAFERNRLVLLLDERQIENLDDEIVIDGENEVTFVRLVPLTGG